MIRKPFAVFPPVSPSTAPASSVDAPPDIFGTYQLVVDNEHVGWVMVRPEQTAFVSVHACSANRSIVTTEYHVEIERYREAWDTCLVSFAGFMKQPVEKIEWRHGLLS